MVDVEGFISRWKPSGGSERANFQQFAIELTQLLGVPAPIRPRLTRRPMITDLSAPSPLSIPALSLGGSLICTDVAASSWKRSKGQGARPRKKTS